MGTDPSRLVENMMHFGHVLRRAGLPIGPGQMIDAIRAVETVGLARRDDFYWTLSTVLVKREDQRELFDQAFHIFWRNPKLLEKMLGLMLPRVDTGVPTSMAPQTRRLADAFFPTIQDKHPPTPNAAAETEIDATFTYSDRERLQKMDFESMSAAELVEARKFISNLRLPIAMIPTRRTKPASQGKKIDMRGTFRSALRAAGGDALLKRRTIVKRHPPLVILCDISGSMTQYARIFLHFIHVLTNDRDRVHVFLFGTQLTNVTRHLRHRDIDIAMAKLSDAIPDWSGGTRICETLRRFNQDWSRRVLGQGAVILFVSDGLDRDVDTGLSNEVFRLRQSCRRLIWLNPLLRYDAFEAKAGGIRAILPHVDDFRPVHNLSSLTDLAAALKIAPRRHTSFLQEARHVQPR